MFLFSICIYYIYVASYIDYTYIIVTDIANYELWTQNSFAYMYIYICIAIIIMNELPNITYLYARVGQ